MALLLLWDMWEEDKTRKQREKELEERIRKPENQSVKKNDKLK
jgi:hypothetical protein